MRCSPILNALVLLVSLCSLAQDKLHVVSSTALPEELRTRFGWGDLRVGCDQDGDTLLALVPLDINPTHEIVPLTPSGAVKARIDMNKVSGLDKANIEDFAFGPNGEIYVVTKKVAWERIETDQAGQAKTVMRKDEPTIWLVRFNATGQLLAKAVMKVNFSFVRIAAFSSGQLLALGYLSPGLTGGWPVRVAPFAGIIANDGSLVLPVKLPETLLETESGKRRAATILPVPMLGNDGNVYVMMPDTKPALAVVSADGSVVRTTSLRIPSGYQMLQPRLAGSRIVAEIWAKELQTSEQFVELDIQTGEIAARHSGLTPGWKLTCQMGSSTIVALNPNGSFDVLETSVGDGADHR